MKQMSAENEYENILSPNLTYSPSSLGLSNNWHSTNYSVLQSDIDSNHKNNIFSNSIIENSNINRDSDHGGTSSVVLPSVVLPFFINNNNNNNNKIITNKATYCSQSEPNHHYNNNHNIISNLSLETNNDINDQRASCHQCKTKKNVNILFCCTKTRPCSNNLLKTKRCRKKYCKSCMVRYYLVHDVNQLMKIKDSTSWLWECPACVQICSCRACTRKNCKNAKKQQQQQNAPNDNNKQHQNFLKDDNMNTRKILYPTFQIDNVQIDTVQTGINTEVFENRRPFQHGNTFNDPSTRIHRRTMNVKPNTLKIIKRETHIDQMRKNLKNNRRIDIVEDDIEMNEAKTTDIHLDIENNKNSDGQKQSNDHNNNNIDFTKIADITIEQGQDFTEWKQITTKLLKQREHEIMKVRCNVTKSIINKAIETFATENGFNIALTLEIDDEYQQKTLNALYSKIDSWKGVQLSRLKANEMKRFKSYFVIGKNWCDQNKTTLWASCFWIKIFHQIKNLATRIGANQFKGQSLSLQKECAHCLELQLIRTIFDETIQFSQTRPQPLIPSRTLKQSQEIQNYLLDLDPSLTVNNWYETQKKQQKGIGPNNDEKRKRTGNAKLLVRQLQDTLNKLISISQNKLNCHRNDNNYCNNGKDCVHLTKDEDKKQEDEDEDDDSDDEEVVNKEQIQIAHYPDIENLGNNDGDCNKFKDRSPTINFDDNIQGFQYFQGFQEFDSINSYYSSDLHILSELEEILYKEMNNMKLLCSQFLQFKQIFLSEDGVTCPGTGGNDSNNASSNTFSNNSFDNQTGNNTFNSNYNNRNNDNNNSNQNGDENNEENKDNNHHNSNNMIPTTCNHLAECSDCSCIMKQIYKQQIKYEEQIKLLKGFHTTLQKQNEYHTNFQKLLFDAMNRASNPQKGHKKRKPKKKKSKLETTDQPKYNPSNAGRGNVKISETFTTKIVPATIKESTSNAYNWINISIGLQCNDEQLKMDDSKYDEQLINCDFHDKVSNESLYCKIRKQENNKKEFYKWKMDDKLYKVSELSGFKLPVSSRIKPSFIEQINNIEQTTLNSDTIQNMINNCKWKNIQIFKRKNNTERMTLSILPKQLNTKIEICRNPNLIPILMFNDNSHWIEYIWIVNIQRNIDIGISLRYNEQTKPIITGIHLDKDYIKMAHEAVSPHNCTCLDGFKSMIHDIHIGNPDDLLNKMKSYQQKYETIKQFVYKFMDEKETEGYESLKQDAKIFMQHDNATLKNWFVPQSPSKSVSSPPSTTISSISLCNSPNSIQLSNTYSSPQSLLHTDSTASPSVSLSQKTSMCVDETDHTNVGFGFHQPYNMGNVSPLNHAVGNLSFNNNQNFNQQQYPNKNNNFNA